METRQIPLVLATLIATALGSDARSQCRSQIFNNSNTAGVRNNPTRPTDFALAKATYIDQIWTYHWNGGKGAPNGGTISLRNLTTNEVHGPWTVTVSGERKQNWNVYPKIDLAAGTYRVVDSSPSTWSHNARSGSRGFARIWGSASCVLGTYRTFGSSCGSCGRPRIAAQPGKRPRAGKPFTVTITGLRPQLPAGRVFLMLGSQRLSPPVELGPVGMRGCSLHTLPAILLPCSTGASGTGTCTIPLPNAPGLVFYTQLLVFDACANPAGIALSNAAEGIVGR